MNSYNSPLAFLCAGVCVTGYAVALWQGINILVRAFS